MGLSTRRYLLVIAATGAGRLVELRVSRRHRRILTAHGATTFDEPCFRWMVLTHVGVLAGSAAEVLLLKRPVIRPLAVAMGVLLVAANALRWWVIHTLGDRWNVGAVDSTVFGIVTDGPFRWLRHPNYLAVSVELAALPLLHTAWLTALAGGLANAWVLSRRIPAEEAVLLRDPEYRLHMASKPRFLPRFEPRLKWRLGRT